MNLLVSARMKARRIVIPSCSIGASRSTRSLSAPNYGTRSRRRESKRTSDPPKRRKYKIQTANIAAGYSYLFKGERAWQRFPAIIAHRREHTSSLRLNLLRLHRFELHLCYIITLSSVFLPSARTHN